MRSLRFVAPIAHELYLLMQQQNASFENFDDDDDDDDESIECRGVAKSGEDDYSDQVKSSRLTTKNNPNSRRKSFSSSKAVLRKADDNVKAHANGSTNLDSEAPCRSLTHPTTTAASIADLNKKSQMHAKFSILCEMMKRPKPPSVPYLMRESHSDSDDSDCDEGDEDEGDAEDEESADDVLPLPGPLLKRRGFADISQSFLGRTRENSGNSSTTISIPFLKSGSSSDSDSDADGDDYANDDVSLGGMVWSLLGLGSTEKRKSDVAASQIDQSADEVDSNKSGLGLGLVLTEPKSTQQGETLQSSNTPTVDVESGLGKPETSFDIDPGRRSKIFVSEDVTTALEATSLEGPEKVVKESGGVNRGSRTNISTDSSMGAVASASEISLAVVAPVTYTASSITNSQIGSPTTGIRLGNRETSQNVDDIVTKWRAKNNWRAATAEDGSIRSASDNSYDPSNLLKPALSNSTPSESRSADPAVNSPAQIAKFEFEQREHDRLSKEIKHRQTMRDFDLTFFKKKNVKNAGTVSLDSTVPIIRNSGVCDDSSESHSPLINSAATGTAIQNLTVTQSPSLTPEHSAYNCRSPPNLTDTSSSSSSPSYGDFASNNGRRFGPGGPDSTMLRASGSTKIWSPSAPGSTPAVSSSLSGLSTLKPKAGVVTDTMGRGVVDSFRTGGREAGRGGYFSHKGTASISSSIHKPAPALDLQKKEREHRQKMNKLDRLMKSKR